MSGYKKERSQIIDIMKGIGIILVIIGHAFPEETFTHRFIYSFHMPLFFILSGLVMRQTNMNLRSIINDKTSISYIIWSIFYLLFDLIVRVAILGEYSLKTIIWESYMSFTLFGINVLWFLSCILMTKVLLKILINKFDKKITFVITIMLYIVVFVISTNISFLTGSLKGLLIYYPLVAILRPFSMLSFMTLGYLFKDAIYSVTNRKIFLYLFTAIASFIIILLLSNKSSAIDIRVLNFGNPLILYITSICGIILTLSISCIINKFVYIKSFFIKFGVSSLLVMVTHNYLKINDLIKEVLIPINIEIVQYVLYITIVIILEYIMISIIRDSYLNLLNKISNKR